MPWSRWLLARRLELLMRAKLVWSHSKASVRPRKGWLHIRTMPKSATFVLPLLPCSVARWAGWVGNKSAQEKKSVVLKEHPPEVSFLARKITVLVVRSEIKEAVRGYSEGQIENILYIIRLRGKATKVYSSCDSCYLIGVLEIEQRCLHLTASMCPFWAKKPEMFPSSL